MIVEGRAVKFVCTYFTKVFDKDPHSRLIQKIRVRELHSLALEDKAWKQANSSQSRH